MDKVKSFSFPRGTKAEVAANPEKYGANGVLRYTYWTEQQLKDYDAYRQYLEERKKAAIAEKWSLLEGICKDIPEALTIIDELKNGSKATKSSLVYQLFGKNNVEVGDSIAIPTDTEAQLKAVGLMSKINDKGKITVVLLDGKIVVSAVND